MRRIATAAATLACLLGGSHALAQEGDAPPVHRARADTQAFESPEQLLDALERADEDIDHLSARVRYTKIFAIAGDAQQREGELRFQLRPRKMFEIRFETLRVGGDVHETPQTFVFDGQWFTEVYPDQKLMVHRRVVPEGERLDPFDLEQGPFPMPIGQRKNAILGRFDARLAPPAEGLEDDELTHPIARRATRGEWIQLVLTPKEGVDLRGDDGERFETLRMWYDPGTLLPVMGMSIEPIDEGLADMKLLEFFKVRTNADAETGDFIVKEPGDDWDIQYRDEARGRP